VAEWEVKGLGGEGEGDGVGVGWGPRKALKGHSHEYFADFWSKLC